MTNNKTSAPASKPAEAAKTLSHNPWDLIEVGSTVLCQSPDPGDGFYPCTVTAVKNTTILTVKWIGYSTATYKPFDVSRNEVGLICKVK